MRLTATLRHARKACGLVLAAGGFLAVLSGIGSSAQAADEKELVFAGFGGSLQKSLQATVIPAFEKKYGVKVVYVTGTSNQILAKVKAQKNSPQIDVIWANDTTHYQGKMEKLYAKLDPAKVPNLSQVYDFAKDRDGIGIVMGIQALGIEYNTQVFKEKGSTVDYMVGTMIELPRAALTADQIAEEAEFFSFGTNDLTQTTFGISRDDINHFLPAYLKNGIFKQDPFATLDQQGVGLLVKMATAKGRNTRANLKVGICGEHGGDPESVKFCHKIGLNYVSCSPFRLLTARLAAAQAALQEQQTGPDIHTGAK